MLYATSEGWESVDSKTRKASEGKNGMTNPCERIRWHKLLVNFSSLNECSQKWHHHCTSCVRSFLQPPSQSQKKPLKWAPCRGPAKHSAVQPQAPKKLYRSLILIFLQRKASSFFWLATVIQQDMHVDSWHHVVEIWKLRVTCDSGAFEKIMQCIIGPNYRIWSSTSCGPVYYKVVRVKTRARVG